MRQALKLLSNRRGATSIEYALVASLISIAAVSAFVEMGDRVDGKFSAVDQALGQHI